MDGTPLQTLIDDPLAGSMFADRYIIEDCVGEGGMGRVYRARHQRVSRKFAIKVLYGDHATDPKMRDRFAREAESASRLDHPNVISVVDFGETDEGLLYLVMDFVEGRELADVVLDEDGLDEARVERLLRGLCLGLAHAHDKDLVHRDFKGENVILTGEGENEVPRIVDFGIAFLVEASDVQRLTTEGMVLGTPAYMSPEQATGSKMDHRTDLFSLGVMLYEMLAGVLPFEGPPLAIARQNLAVDPPPISERVPGSQVSPRLEAIAMRLMAKKPDDRFQSAQEIIDALDSSVFAPAPTAPKPEPARVSGHAETAPNLEIPRTTEVTRQKRHNRAPWVIALIALLAAGATVAIVLLRGGDSGKAEPSAAVVVDAGAPHATAADATVVAAAPILDANPGVAKDTNPTKTTRPKRTGKSTRKSDQGSSKTDPPKKDPPKQDPPPKKDPPKKQITTSDLTSRYKAVGGAIERLAKKRGAEAAGPYRTMFSKIPFADALRTPSLRLQVDRKLRSLQSRVQREMKK